MRRCVSVAKVQLHTEHSTCSRVVKDRGAATLFCSSPEHRERIEILVAARRQSDATCLLTSCHKSQPPPTEAMTNGQPDGSESRALGQGGRKKKEDDPGAAGSE